MMTSLDIYVSKGMLYASLAMLFYSVVTERALELDFLAQLSWSAKYSASNIFDCCSADSLFQSKILQMNCLYLSGR